MATDTRYPDRWVVTFGTMMTHLNHLGLPYLLAEHGNGSAYPTGCVSVCLSVCVCDVGVLWLNA